MASLFNVRQLAFGAIIVAGGLLTAAAPAEAQGRMRVLVPPFENAQGEATRDGERLAEEVRKHINNMAMHAPVEKDAWEDALDQHDLDEDDMDCIKWQQLARIATAMDVGLVLCGKYDPSTQQVSGSFAPVGGSDPFDVPAFAFQSREQAAQQVVQVFETYTRQLALLQYCDEAIRNENWSQALDYCNQSVELNPRSTSSHYARGSALLNMDRIDEALVAFEQVLEVDPIHTDALQAAGFAAAQLGRQDVSQRYFRDYLAMNPGDVQVRLTIATTLANEGDPSGALLLVEEATAEPDATAQLFQYAGHFAMNAGLQLQQAGGPAAGATGEATPFFHKAITNYERALALQPDSVDASVLRQLMLAYSNVGNVDKALEVGVRATAAGDDAQAFSIYAEVLKQAGRTEEAIAALARAEQIDPTQQNLAARRGLLLLELDRLEDATAAFQQAVAQGGMQEAQAETIAKQMAVKGFQATQAGRLAESLPYYAAARELGKSELTIGMINFFHGYTVLKQGEPIIKEGNNAAAGRQAKPLFERARTLLQGAAAYTDQAAVRAQLLADINQFIEVADALIRAGR